MIAVTPIMTEDGPVVSAAWLHAHLSHPRLRIVDCRHRFDDAGYGENAYRTSHIPGAAYFGLKSHLVGITGDGRSPLPQPEDFARRVGAAGIANDDTVVCYDDGPAGVAARAWWLFRLIGHEKVFVLRDGFKSWIYDTEAGERASIAMVPFHVRRALVSFVDATQVLAVSTAEDATIIDARPPARFRGDAPPLDPIEGHIPGAINIPADALAGSDRFRACVADARRIIAYCGSGILACNVVLAATALGRKDVALYAGSWSDWAARRLPARSGAETGPSLILTES